MILLFHVFPSALCILIFFIYLSYLTVPTFHSLFFFSFLLRFSFFFFSFLSRGVVSNYISSRIFTSPPNWTFIKVAKCSLQSFIKKSVSALFTHKKRKRKGTVRIKFYLATIYNPTLSFPKIDRLLTHYSSKTKTCSPKLESCSVLSVQSSSP